MSDQDRDSDNSASNADSSQLTTLMYACQSNNYEDAKNLINQGVDVNELDINQRSALFYCMDHKDTRFAELLCDALADVNLQDREGYSCLHLAVISGNQSLVEYLHKRDASLNVIDNEKHGLIHWCVVCGHYDILEFLLKNACNCEVADIHGAYPLHYAAQMCGVIDVWDDNITRDVQKSLEILKLLIQHKVCIEVEDSDGRNPMIWASSSGSAEALLELFNAGGDPSKKEKDGLTSLHCAASRGHMSCVKVLLDQCKVSIDVQDNNKCTPLFYSAAMGQVEVTDYLIKNGALLVIQDIKGRTVYHCAAAKGQFECLELLCNHNSVIWAPNNRGDFPVHEAYYSGNMECVYHLLNTYKKAIKSANTIDGRTLLHLAAAENDEEFCEKLLREGAYVNALLKTSAGTYLTPYDVAKIKDSEKCLKIIKQYSGVSGIKIANVAASKIQQNAKRFMQKQLSKKSLNQKERSNMNKSNNGKNDKSNKKNDKKLEVKTSQKVETNQNKSLKRDETDLNKNNHNNNNNNKSNAQKELRDQSAQTNIRSTTHKLIMLSSAAASPGDMDEEIDSSFFKSNSDNLESSNSEVFNNDSEILNQNQKQKSNNLKQKNDENIKKQKRKPQKPVQLKPPTPKTHPAAIRGKNLKRFHSDKGLNEAKIIESNNDVKKIKKPHVSLSASNSFSSLSITSNSSDTTTFYHPEESHHSHHHHHRHHQKVSRSSHNHQSKSLSTKHSHYHSHMHHHHHHDKEKVSETDNDENYKKELLKTKYFETDVEVKKNNAAKYNNENEKFPNIFDNAHTDSSQKIIHDQLNGFDIGNQTNIQKNDEASFVKLVIKTDFNENSSQLNTNYNNLYERQNLLLRSLYEIRRSRLNNRDIIISTDLNNLLLKRYNFDIQKNCKSLKEFEKALEDFAIEVSEQLKKLNKNSKNSKSKANINGNPNTSLAALSINGTYTSSNTSRTTESQSKQTQSITKSKSSHTFKQNEEQNPKVLEAEYLKQKREYQNSQLKIAYRPLLPDDIYRQHYGKSTRLTIIKQSSPRDKTIILPVLKPK